MTGTGTEIRRPNFVTHSLHASSFSSMSETDVLVERQMMEASRPPVKGKLAVAALDVGAGPCHRTATVVPMATVTRGER